MKTTNLRRLSWMLLATPLLLALPATADHGGDGGEKDEGPIVIRSLGACPEIKIRSASGEPIEWIGSSTRGFLGVELTALTPELRQHFGVPGDSGVMIARVVEDSAAATAGLAVGDIITRIDGEAVTSAGSVGRAVRQKEGGEIVDVEVWRDGSLRTLTVTLGERERCAFDLGHLQGLDVQRLGEMGWEISGEALEALRGVDWEEALENLRAIDWEKHFEGLRIIDKERIERRMERTQERLEQLEERLEREQERLQRLEREEREKVERAREREQRELERKQRDKERGEEDSDSEI